MILAPGTWLKLQHAHGERANLLLKKFRHPGGYHPVYDFLFDYYPVRPSHLRRWHPGVEHTLAGDPPHAQWRFYRSTPQGIGVDTRAWWERRGEAAEVIRELLKNTQTNPASFDCFGLHEWAMVYRTEKPRHSLPLRLGAEATNEVVESHKIKCTHYDAFRFFTKPAVPLNFTVLSRERQRETEQKGCVHATMDIYKWAWKLGPLVPGELLLDAFELAVAARVLDMEASPYDCTDWGFGVVAIETPEGKAQYVARQRELSRRAQPFREKLIALINAADPATSGIAAETTPGEISSPSA